MIYSLDSRVIGQYRAVIRNIKLLRNVSTSIVNDDGLKLHDETCTKLIQWFNLFNNIEQIHSDQKQFTKDIQSSILNHTLVLLFLLLQRYWSHPGHMEYFRKFAPGKYNGVKFENIFHTTLFPAHVDTISNQELQPSEIRAELLDIVNFYNTTDNYYLKMVFINQKHHLRQLLSLYHQ